MQTMSLGYCMTMGKSQLGSEVWTADFTAIVLLCIIRKSVSPVKAENRLGRVCIVCVVDRASCERVAQYISPLKQE